MRGVDMDVQIFVPRECPICKTNNNECSRTELLYVNSFAKIEGVSFLQGYNVVSCIICGGTYADNIPKQDDFDSYYNTKNKYEQITVSGEKQIPDWYRYAVNVFSQSLSNKDAYILEIGCGVGYLMYALKEAGYYNLTGLDFSSSNVEYIRTRLGIPCIEGSLFQLSNMSMDAQFDAVCMIAVLEHIVDTHKAIGSIASLIKTNGLLLIVVPNSATLDPTISGPYQEFSTEHINYFCAESVKNLFGLHGFELTVVDTQVKESLLFVCKKTGLFTPIIKETQSKLSLQNYINRSASLNIQMIEQLSLFKHEKLIVWGTGTHTLRLLASGVLCADNVKLLVDSNPHYWGGDFAGIPVIAPDELHKHTERILISSFDWMDDILYKIENELCLQNEIVCIRD